MTGAAEPSQKHAMNTVKVSLVSQLLTFRCQSKRCDPATRSLWGREGHPARGVEEGADVSLNILADMLASKPVQVSLRPLGKMRRRLLWFENLGGQGVKTD